MWARIRRYAPHTWAKLQQGVKLRKFTEDLLEESLGPHHMSLDLSAASSWSQQERGGGKNSELGVGVSAKNVGTLPKHGWEGPLRRIWGFSPQKPTLPPSDVISTSLVLRQTLTNCKPPDAGGVILCADVPTFSPSSSQTASLLWGPMGQRTCAMPNWAIPCLLQGGHGLRRLTSTAPDTNVEFLAFVLFF